jgi:hypothetical protein
MKMKNGYLGSDWMQLEEELKDAFRYTDTRVYIYKRSYIEGQCWEQLEHGNVGQGFFILTNNNISRIMLNNGAFTEYLQVAMPLGALQRDL